MIYGPPLDAGLALLIQQGHLGNAIANHAESNMAAPVVHVLVSLLEEIKLKPERVIANIALTQKDTISDQLHIVSISTLSCLYSSECSSCQLISREFVSSISDLDSASPTLSTPRKERFIINMPWYPGVDTSNFSLMSSLSWVPTLLSLSWLRSRKMDLW